MSKETAVEWLEEKMCKYSVSKLLVKSIFAEDFQTSKKMHLKEIQYAEKNAVENYKQKIVTDRMICAVLKQTNKL